MPQSHGLSARRFPMLEKIPRMCDSSQGRNIVDNASTRNPKRQDGIMKSAEKVAALVLIGLGTVLIIGLIIGFAEGTAHAKMYKWTDDEGVVHWSNRPPVHDDAEEHFEFEHRKEFYRQRRHTPETERPASYPDPPPPRPEVPSAPAPEHPWAGEALLALKDISSLVGTVGVAYQDYRALVQEAAMIAGRVSDRERRETLFDVIEFHEIALACWYNDIFSRAPFTRGMSDVKYKIFREHDVIVQTYEQCLQEMWTLASKGIRRYEDRF